jgi:hypothetical protein
MAKNRSRPSDAGNEIGFRFSLTGMIIFSVSLVLAGGY